MRLLRPTESHSSVIPAKAGISTGSKRLTLVVRGRVGIYPSFV